MMRIAVIVDDKTLFLGNEAEPEIRLLHGNEDEDETAEEEVPLLSA